MTRFVQSEDRRQGVLLPEYLDDYVAEDNPVRVIDVFVDELDLGALGFDGVIPEATGRPAYHPGALLKIYVYGYINQIASSRRLEREPHRNVELMWLTGGLTPDFKTEYTNVNGTLNAFTYSAGGATLTATSANNDYYNIAPEGALIYRPDSDWLIKARVGTGYGTPQASNLFVTPSGVAGNNTQLKSQTNLGYDLAVVWTPLETVKLSVDGFYEFFRNELISQSPGPSPLLTYTFNAPRSEGKGRLHLRQPNLYPIFGAAQRRDQNLRFQSRRPLASRYRPE